MNNKDKRELLENDNIYEFEGNDGTNKKYKIIRCIGKGGNSIVYEVSHDKYEYGRLKEFYPYYIENIKRDESGNLEVEKGQVQEFEERKEQFENIVDKRNELIQINSKLLWTMPEYYELLRGRNTSYIFQSYTKGICYSGVDGESLGEILHTIKELVKVLKCYHDIGYVHLDVKPENMLISKADNEIKVQLFDFETATLIEKIKMGDVNILPYTDNYSAPEVVKGDYNNVGIQSDIYSVGIILFHKLMGRFPKSESRELSMGAQYEYDAESRLFEGVSLLIWKYFDELFEHTIRIHVGSRYKDDFELLKIIDRLIEFTENRPELVQKNNYISDINEFYGRRKEIDDIYDAMQEKSILLIYGMGGIGKSELVKEYINENEECFHKIIYIDETSSSIRDAIVSDDNVEIKGIKRPNELSDDEYFDNKVEIIKKECIQAKKLNKQIIIIFDNIEFFSNLEYLLKLKKAGCKLILVSRDPWEGVDFDAKIQLLGLKSEDAINLFNSYLEYDYLLQNETDKEKKIIEYYDGHPLLIKFIAKYMNASGKLPGETLKEIQEKGLESYGTEEIRYIEHDIIKQKKIEDIVYELFGLYNFSTEEIATLQFMSLVPAEGIKKSEIIYFLDKKDAVNLLVSKGIISSNNGCYRISTIIKELVRKYYNIDEDNIKKYIHDIKNLLSTKKNFRNLSYKQVVTYVNIGNNIEKIAEVKDDDFYDKIGNACQRIGQFKLAIEYYDKSIKLAKDKYGDSDRRVASLYMRYGRILGKNGEYEKSKVCLDKSEEIFSQTVSIMDSELLVNNNFGYIGMFRAFTVSPISLIESTVMKKLIKMRVNKNKQNTNESMTYNDMLDISKTYNQLARWHCNRGDYKKSLEYANLAYSIANAHAKTNARANEKLYYFSDTIGEILYELGKYEEALEYYEKAYKIKKGIYTEENVYMIHSYFGIAKCKYRLKDNKEALDYILKALDLSKNFKGHYSDQTARICHYVAKIYQELGFHKETIMYYDQAQKIEESLLGKNNSLWIAVNVDYLHYKVCIQNENIKIEDYSSLKLNIQTKERPRTNTLKEICNKMKEISLTLKINDDCWDSYLKQFKK